MTRIRTVLLAAIAASVFLTGCEPMWWNPLPRKEDRAREREEAREKEREDDREDDRDETAYFSPARRDNLAPRPEEYSLRNNSPYGNSSYADLQPRQMETRIPGVFEGFEDGDSASADAYASRAMPEPERERVIYDPRVDARPPEFVDPETITKTVYSSKHKPFAGAMVGRSNPASVRSMEAKQVLKKPAQMPGQSDRRQEMFVSKPVPVTPSPSNELAYEEDMRMDDEVRAKAAAAASGAFSAMAAPAPAAAQRSSLPKAEVRMEIPLNSAPPSVPGKEPLRLAPPPTDEIFTPDLFLS